MVSKEMKRLVMIAIIISLSMESNGYYGKKAPGTTDQFGNLLTKKQGQRKDGTEDVVQYGWCEPKCEDQGAEKELEKYRYCVLVLPGGEAMKAAREQFDPQKGYFGKCHDKLRGDMNRLDKDLLDKIRECGIQAVKATGYGLPSKCSKCKTCKFGK